MTKEELMKPRVIVENLYHDCPFSANQILYLDENKIAGPMYVDDIASKSPDYILKKEADKYPYLFRELSWWEERAESDMPEYVKTDDGEVYKIKDWDNFRVPYVFVDPRIHKGYVDECTSCPLYADRLPSTLSEYQSFNQNKVK